MDIRRIESFLAVAEFGGFRPAAERLHRSQSVVSTHVQQLENELRVPLFDRTTRRVVLTLEGELLRDRARSALADLREVARELSEHASLRRGHVSIGTVPSVSAYRLPEACVHFRKAYPGVTLELHEGAAPQIYADLRDRVTDFAVGPNLDDDPAYVHHPVFDDEFVVAVPDGLTVPSSGLTLRQWARYDQVAQPQGTGLRGQIDAAFARSGLTFRPRIEVAHHHTVLAMVGAGLGVAILPRLCVPPNGIYPLRSVPLRSPRIVRQIGLLTLKGKRLSPAATVCARVVAEALRG